MEFLQASVDGSVIALWLDHESIKTTQVYLHAHATAGSAAVHRPISLRRSRFNVPL
jgi:site-specific recombinase XerD